jgi:uncharacterized secreted protein with C-terminal beta-propeller domain
MVQKEISKKIPAYGLIGILSAIVLVALIYSYGTAPIVSPPNASPSATPFPSAAPISLATSLDVSSMRNFASADELVSFLTSNTNGGQDSFGRPSTLPTPEPAPTTAPTYTASGPKSNIGVEGATKDYSTTNIQVAGVDEADTVKTDGTYLYLIANNSIYIMNANPQNAKVIAKIAADNTYYSGIYLSQDSSKLAVIGNQYTPYNFASKDSALIMPYWGGSTTFVKVYDVSNKASPALTRNFTISGNYVNSRMIGNYVYTIVNENVQVNNGTTNMPVVFTDASASNIEPTKIYYTIAPDSYSTYTTIISLNILEDSKAPTETTIMMGGASNMFVSADNIYVTYQNWNGESQDTSIYRIHINQDNLTFEAKGVVPGYPINQYAMDEYNGYFRIAVTTWFQDNATTIDGAVFKVSRQLNCIYVLNMNLNVVGKLERFKMDETIYSVRFMGNKCYVVTFKQIDPFFVIDMSNPVAPKVAGELKIPGYSSYLHPYDENHIIGLGKENNTLKLSLFDVTNMNAPTEIAKYTVDASYSDSSALYDPHAFLFDAQRQLLGIPVSITNYPRGIEVSAQTPSMWQGMYIFNVSANSGFTLRGNVTQIDSDVSTQSGDYYWMSSNYWINRALYIDNTLYTLSNARVQLNSLDNFALQAKIDLN